MQEMALEKAENLLLNVRNTEIILLIGAHHAENGQVSAKAGLSHPVRAALSFCGTNYWGSSSRVAQPPASSRHHLRGNPSAE
jgi:hypothetical protein